MPKYKYRFCDGVEKEIEVSDMEYALLKQMDARETADDRKHKRRCAPLDAHNDDGDKGDG